MSPNLIGLAGKAGAGKDSLAAVLVTELGYRRVAFADALKEAALASDPFVWTGTTAHPGERRDGWGNYWRLSQLVRVSGGWDKAKTFPDVRRYLQNYGVAMRDALPGCWVNIAMTRVDLLLAAGLNVVITDVRFPDEAQAIFDSYGSTVRVTRHDNDLNLGNLAEHISERNVDTIRVDTVISNDGTLADLAEQAKRLHVYTQRTAA